MRTADATHPGWSIGLRPTEPARLHTLLLGGLPFVTIERLGRRLAVPAGAVAKAVRIAPRTLARRKTAARFTTEESEKLFRLARVFERAVELFAGDEAAARMWLANPVRGLGYQVPLDLAQTQVGADMVLTLIGQLEHGVYP